MNLSNPSHFQSPWLSQLELDRAKMVDRKLMMASVAGRIAETFQTDLFVILSEDKSEKLIIHCKVMDSPDKEDDGSAAIEADVFLPIFCIKCSTSILFHHIVIIALTGFEMRSLWIVFLNSNYIQLRLCCQTRVWRTVGCRLGSALLLQLPDHDGGSSDLLIYNSSKSLHMKISI
jgi:RNA polymerase Rpb1, domain 7